MTATTGDTSILETLRQAVGDATAAGRVFGTPVEHDGVVVLPAARVVGGGGGGSGSGSAPAGRQNGSDGDDTGTDTGSGAGGGFGVMAEPAGAFVISGGKVRWRPAINVNRLALGGQIIAITGLLVARAVLRAWARKRDR